ncbi:MAG: GntR family transcriptional regulator [Spirochaetales bacterium]|nr:GntR family transcriptional regulator [Spirochaetales bacterium]
MAARTQPPALSFRLDPKSGVPYYKQIILQVELAIAGGRLSTGDQLPTVRALAVELKINPNTVARAYNEMEIRSIVTTQQGTGTFVGTQRPALQEIEREKALEELVRPFVNRALESGFSGAEVIQAVRDALSGTDA